MLLQTAEQTRMLSPPYVNAPEENPAQPLSAELIQAGLISELIGRKIYCFERIDSTNRAAKEYAHQGTPEGTVVLADMQTSGRGRLDRSWISPPGCNLYCSFILYPDLAPHAAARMTMLISLAVLRAIARVCAVEAFIKWPNDIYIQNRKVCGILSEFSSIGDRIAYVVVGTGINVNFDPDAYPAISATATSLRKACGHPVSRLKLAQSLFHEADKLYLQFSRSGMPDLHRLWKQHSLIINREVVLAADENSCRRGIARDFTENGHLILEDAQGMLHEVLCGDVSLTIT